MTNEILLGIGLSVSCADGSEHHNVIMKIIDGKTIYLTEEGENLTAGNCVVKINSGEFVESLMVIGLAIDKYKEDYS
jgi:hypothetical protein